MSANDLESLMQNYEEMARAVPPLDSAIGRLLDAVDRRDPNTLVIFLSDNGYMYGEHAQAGKVTPYEEAVRVPFVVRYPPVIPTDQPTTSQALIGNMDIAPTIMDLAGVPWGADGTSLMPLLRGEVDTLHDGILIEACQARSQPGADRYRCPLTIWKDFWGIITNQFMYTEYGGGDDARELYDLYADPYEMNNLAMPNPDPAVVAEWSARLAALVAPQPAPDTTIAIGPGDTSTHTAYFEVFSQQLGSTLDCRLLGPGRDDTWQPCRSGRVPYQNLPSGEYTFEARATNPGGVLDDTPANRRFVVP
jgi:arylsulfatase A-like enzyme